MIVLQDVSRTCSIGGTEVHALTGIDLEVGRGLSTPGNTRARLPGRLIDRLGRTVRGQAEVLPDKRR